MASTDRTSARQKEAEIVKPFEGGNAKAFRIGLGYRMGLTLLTPTKQQGRFARLHHTMLLVSPAGKEV